MTAFDDMIRPWWPGRDGDHINPGCPLLLAETDEPTEGTGWLDPKQATKLCPSCFVWDATCRCGASMATEMGGPQSKTATDKWMGEHFCFPTIDLTPHPAKNQPAAPPADHPALFPLTDLTAERTAA